MYLKKPDVILGDLVIHRYLLVFFFLSGNNLWIRVIRKGCLNITESCVSDSETSSVPGIFYQEGLEFSYLKMRFGNTLLLFHIIYKNTSEDR